MTTAPVWHAFTRHGPGEAAPCIVAASGAWLTCVDGTRLLDGLSSWRVIAHGHDDPRFICAPQAIAAPINLAHLRAAMDNPA